MIKTKIPVKYNQRNPALEAKIMLDIPDYKFDVKRQEIVLTVIDYAVLTQEIEAPVYDEHDNQTGTEIQTIETKTQIDKKLYRMRFDEVEALKAAVETQFDFVAITESDRIHLIKYGLYLKTITDPEPIYQCPPEQWELMS